MIRIVVFASFLAFAMLPAALAGAEEAEVELTAGVLYVQRANHEWVHGDPVIKSLDDEAQSGSVTYPLIMLEVSYTPGDGGAEFYADSPISEDSSIGFGMRADAGPAVLDLFVFVTIGMELWKDPFVLDQRRQETWATIYGASLGLSELGGTPVALKYGVEVLSVGQDLAGAT